MSLKKIMVKNTTKLSINERFTYLRSNPEPAGVPMQRIRAASAVQQQASARNRRLAQQMERRPAVMAALKIKKRSLRQRLGQTWDGSEGVNVKDRLTLTVPNLRGSFRGSRSRGSRGRGASVGTGPRGRGLGATRRNQMTTIRSRGFRPNISRSIPLRQGLALQAQTPRPFRRRGLTRGQATLNVGLRGRGLRQLRGASPRVQYRGVRRPLRASRGSFQSPRGHLLQQRSRATVRGGRGVSKRGRGMQPTRGIQQARGNSSVRGRGGRGRGVRGRGRRQSQQVPVSKEELDKQLDQYMSSTRTNLDRELDSYMETSVPYL